MMDEDLTSPDLMVDVNNTPETSGRKNYQGMFEETDHFTSGMLHPLTLIHTGMRVLLFSYNDRTRLADGSKLFCSNQYSRSADGPVSQTYFF
jgi:hypothetical protein